MSGGSFNYAYNTIAEFAKELDDRLVNASKVNQWNEQPDLFGQQTLDKLRQIQLAATHFSELMRTVEYLYSGDIRDDTFLNRVSEIENAASRASAPVVSVVSVASEDDPAKPVEPAPQ